jgi:acetolactate synthase I/II/III large subunit
MRATNYLVESLRAEGIGHVFCVPGGLIDPFLPALSGTEGVETVVAAHEGGAGYMADGYARASGRFGVCMAIGGPGISNMATAVSAARSDGSPVLVISGQVATSLEGRGAFQDDSAGTAVDDTAALAPLAVSSQQVVEPHLIGHHLRHALATMLAAPRGPAHLVVPVDVQRAEVSAPPPPTVADRYAPRLCDREGLRRVLEVLAPADSPGPERVVVLAGSGVDRSGAGPELRRFAERFSIPVATTLRAKGVLAEDHDLSLGVYGYAGTRHAIEAILDPELEVLLVVGSGLNQRDTMFWERRMIAGRTLVHVDIDPTAIGRTWPTEAGLVADAGTFLGELGALEGPAAASLERSRAVRRDFLTEVRSRGPLLYDEDHARSDAMPIHPARAVAELRRAFPRQTVLVVDSGAHRAFCGHYWRPCGPRAYISATNLGPMGWGIGAAIGAKLARPELPLACVTGDGCMLMHGLEVQTAARHGVDLTYVVLNNGALGNVWLRARQVGPGPAALTELPVHDWAQVARGLGAEGITVERPDELADAYAAARDTAGTVVVDVRCDRAQATPVSPWQRAKAEWVDSD